MKKKSGTLVLAQGTIEYSENNIPAYCTKCQGFFQRSSYSRHRCLSNLQSSSYLKNKAAPLKEGDAFLHTSTYDISTTAAAMIARIKNDPIGNIVKNDGLALKILEFNLHRGDSHEENWQKNFR